MSQLQIKRNPQNFLVTATDIKAKRDMLEQKPVIIGTDTVDCDALSLDRMKDAVDNWSDITLMKDVMGWLGWIMADGSVVYFSEAAFSTFAAQVKQKKVIRRDKLFKAGQDFLGLLPNVTVAMIADTEWPT